MWPNGPETTVNHSARFVLFAGRCPRVSLAFDGAEMEVFAVPSVYLFRPFGRLPVNGTNIFAFCLPGATTNGNDD
jgi:hypothetical protein